MSTTDRRVYRFAAFAREYIQFYAASVPINQNNAVIGQVTPYQGYLTSPYNLYGWQVENVQYFCTAITNNATIMVAYAVAAANISFSLSPTAGAVLQVGLQPGAQRGKFSEGIKILATTNGTGTITNLLVTVTIRPYPLDGEAA